MKRILLILLLIPFLSFSQKTFVPDDIFEAWFEANGYGDSIPYNDSVTTSAISAITSLGIEGFSISDLTGIEDIPNLHILNARYNSLTNVDFSNNKNLYRLYLEYNQISQITLPDSSHNNNNSPLELYLSDNILNSITFPQTLRISRLSLVDNPLDSIDLSTLYDLYALSLKNSNLITLDLSNNHNLHEINITENSSLATIDLRNINNLVYARIFDNNSLSNLDMRNSNLFSISTNYYSNLKLNNSLSCISVDNIAVADATIGSIIDPWCSFSLNCNGLGCTDSNAINFDPSALVDDGSCTYCIYGCTDSIAPNYDSLATCDDGTCGSPTVYGCTNINALNYNPNATFDNGFCNFSLTYVPDDIFEAYLESIGCGDEEPFNDSVSTTAISALTTLGVQGFSILDLTGVEDMPDLTTLNARYNSLTNVDFSNNNNLHRLYLDYNQISQITLPDSSYNNNNIPLELYLTYNILNSITFPQTLRIDYLNLTDNPLDSIDLSTLYDLYNLRIENSNITTLDLSNNFNLFYLRVLGNSLLEFIDLTDLTNLSNAIIYDNVSLLNLDMRNSNLFSYNTTTYNHTFGGITSFTNNNSLNCISVDNIAVADATIGSVIDPWCSFSLNCTGLGCTDSTAINFDPSALVDDSSCTYCIYGCTDPIAPNYDSLATCDNGTCGNPTVYGCTDTLAINYDSLVTIDNGSCNFLQTYVPDDIFEAYLESIGCGDKVPFNDSVSTTAISALTTLDIEGFSILDLTGIEDMPNLNFINAGYNGLSTVDFSNNNKLHHLDLENNQISQIILPDSSYNNNTTPIDLFLNYNLLTSISFPQTLRVHDLYLEDNPLDSINLSSLYDLRVVKISNSNITTLELSNNNSLRQFRVWGNSSLVSIDLKNKSNLEWCYIYDNILLTDLDMRNCNLFTINTNPGNRHLTRLDNNNSLSCISVTDSLVADLVLSSIIDPWCSFSNNCTDLGCTDSLAVNYDPTSIIDDGTCAYSLLTYVPDDNFENYIENMGWGDGVLNNDSVSTLSIIPVSLLNISNLSIYDLTGIEHFISLRNLYCINNYIVDIDLTDNLNLEVLFCDGNQIDTLDLSNNTSLYSLYCNYNQITNLDVSNNPLLTNLYCAGNQISTLDVTQSTSLIYFSCAGNQLSSLDVSNSLNLLYLQAYNNNISYIDVSDNENLVYFDCSSNQLIDLNLSDNPFLNYLACSANLLDHLDVRNGNNTNISDFFATNNPTLTCISVDDSTYSTNNWFNIDIQTSFSNYCLVNNKTFIPDDNFEFFLEANGMGDGIAQNDSVYTFNIYYVDTLVIQNLSIADLTGIQDFEFLEYLDCSHNSLTSVDLSNNEVLASLYCNNNLLDSIDISQNLDITTLNCESNQLYDIDISQNSSLVILKINDNNIASIDISQNTDLSILNISNNQLDSIDLSYNNGLEQVFISNNQLTDLDLTQNFTLHYLDCSSNQLNELDLRNANNSSIVNSSFYADDNIYLSCISVDDSIFSTNSWFNIDAQSFFSNDCFYIIGGCTDTIAINFNVYANTDDGSCLYAGCTDSNAMNYDSIADFDDGSCIYSGCTDTIFCNYDPIALIDDGSCLGYFGCTDSTQFNYDPLAGCDDGSCISILYGCTDTTAVNFNIFANTNDGSCIYTGCTNSTSCNYNPLAAFDDGSCWGYFGCTDSTAINYDSLAACNDGSCVPYIYGCTDPIAINFFSAANTDDGSCIYSGCTDSIALNFDSLATIDDSSCVYYGCLEPAPTNLFTNDVVDTKATINWDNMNSSTCRVLKYVIRYQVVGSNSWITKSGGEGNGLCNFGINNTSKVLQNLTPFTTYRYKIKAFYCFGNASTWTLPKYFTTDSICPGMINLTATTFNFNQSKVRFDWDTTSMYIFARIALRVDTTGAGWQTAGGYGIFYPTLYVNKFGLQPGQSYRAQGRTFCDPTITSFRSWWTQPIFWTQPGSIRLNGGSQIDNFMVYPNPSRDIFNLSFNLDMIEDVKISIYNLIGEVVFEEEKRQFVGEYIKKINMSNYKRGVYFLKIETENKSINKKLVLQ